ncbi:WAT1-related protein At2g37460-like isoform X2 [Malania oleifera]|nr:WAT1-related protein At2g37460-like isoform X2 [Malania oleifera]XP_057971234.1 WAT1-related protein At2g37460-like isoform X2 [Malania oleifera]
MTRSVFIKIMLIGLLEPVLYNNLNYVGMMYTSASFAAAMSNTLPAIAFLLACIFRFEMVKIKDVRSQAKVIGTLATVAGAMVLSLVKGPIIELIWEKGRRNYDISEEGATSARNTIKGSLLIIIGCFSWASSIIVQAITLRTYPAELSLTAWICLASTVEGAALALIMERGKATVWSLHWDVKLLAVLYNGMVGIGVAYYIQGLIVKARGPVFVTAFSPLSLVFVAILASFILNEHLYLGRIIGAIVIIIGLYLILWGKSKDYESSSPSTSNDHQTTSAVQQAAVSDNCNQTAGMP